MSLPGQVASVEEETRQAPSWGLRRNHYGLAKAARGDESGWRRAVVVGAESPCGTSRNPCFGWLRPLDSGSSPEQRGRANTLTAPFSEECRGPARGIVDVDRRIATHLGLRCNLVRLTGVIPAVVGKVRTEWLLR